MHKSLAALAALCLTACGGNDVDDYNRMHPVVAGSFEHLFAQLHASPSAGACERRFESLHKDLASELDHRREALTRIFSERPTSSAGSSPWLKPWGPISLDTHPVTGADRMEPYRKSWARVEPALRRAQRDDDWELWQGIYGFTAGMLADERNRHAGLSLGLTDTTLPYVEELQRSLDTCLADASCGDLTLSRRAKDYVSRGNAAYARIWARLQGSALRSVKRKALRELSEQVGVDLSFFTSLPNEAIQVAAGGELRLPLDAGEFHAVKGDIQRIIEETWRGDGLQVRVDWTTRQQNAGAYLFVAYPTEGRAHVRHDNRTINLYQATHAKVIAHELGHVLGLPDHYYTEWNESACEYSVSIDNLDIMSNHMTGSVTRGELDSLRAMYELGH